MPLASCRQVACVALGIVAVALVAVTFLSNASRVLQDASAAAETATNTETPTTNATSETISGDKDSNASDFGTSSEMNITEHPSINDTKETTSNNLSSSEHPKDIGRLVYGFHLHEEQMTTYRSMVQRARMLAQRRHRLLWSQADSSGASLQERYREYRRRHLLPLHNYNLRWEEPNALARAFRAAKVPEEFASRIHVLSNTPYVVANTTANRGLAQFDGEHGEAGACNETGAVPPCGQSEGQCAAPFAVHTEATLLQMRAMDTACASGKESALPNVTRWQAKSRWLLDEHVPFATEESCIPVPPSSTPYFAAKRSHASMSFFALNNVCISSTDGGLSAKFGDTNSKNSFYRMNDLQDEKRSRIRRQLYVRNREHFPTCMVRTPVLLHPVLFQSDNLGHVMYRVLATNHLLTKLKKHVSPRYANATIGFYVTSSALHTFGAHNKYKVFYQMMGHRWFSVMSPGTLPEAKKRQSAGQFDEGDDLCFETVYLGWAHVPMYPVKNAAFAGSHQRNYVDEYVNVSNAALGCFSHTPRAVRAAEPRITWISRKKRRLLDEGSIAVEIARRFPQATVNVVDFDGVSVQQQIEIASHTDILIGVHGTAMQWAIVMPPRSVLVELQSPLHSCTMPGINHPSRQFCEFGQTTLLMGVTHIVHRASVKDVVCNSSLSVAWCDVRVREEDILSLVARGVCMLSAASALSNRSSSDGRKSVVPRIFVAAQANICSKSKPPPPLPPPGPSATPKGLAGGMNVGTT